jgi:type I restriction-modification system DNA methylase subunit
LNELDEIKAQLEGGIIDKSSSKRKKDGVFYTPKYITKYIVDNTIGKLCTEKKAELNINEEDYISTKAFKPLAKKTKQPLFEKLTTYRNWLIQITICDPACGSGAFLNQALDFLIQEHRYIDELQAKLFGDAMVLSDVEKSILENNLYGVDLNEESVEIAKLSLWLRTAQPNRKLNDLNNNIKCGNSLIDDVAIAGEKAFNWQTSIPKIFKEKNKKAYHLVFTTHNSRISQRMIDLKVIKGPALELNLEEEIALTKIFKQIILENHYNCLAYNVCKDHVHIIIVCEEDEVNTIAKTLKGKSSYLYQSNGFKPIGEPLWSQKFFFANLNELIWSDISPRPGHIASDTYLENAINYIKTNREKHQLTDSKELKNSIKDFVVDLDVAFASEYKGGFDVIIGNPPYVQIFDTIIKTELEKKYDVFKRNNDLYSSFYELSINILNKNGILGFITPNSFVKGDYFKNLREFFIKFQINSIVDFNNYLVFEDANVFSAILILEKKAPSSKWVLKSDLNTVKGEIEIGNPTFIQENSILNKFINCKNFEDYFLIKDVGFNYWSVGGEKKRGNSIGDRVLYKGVKQDEKDISYTKGSNFNKYSGIENENFLKHNYSLFLNDNDTFRFSESLLKINPKLIYRQTSSTLISTVDFDSNYCDKTVHIIVNRENVNINSKYLMTVFNSKLLNYFYKLSTEELGRAFAQVKTVNIKKLPFLLAENQESFIEKADLMLSLNKDLQEQSQKFQRTIQRKFFSTTPMGLNPLENTSMLNPLENTSMLNPLEVNLPKKLQDWYLLSYTDFIKELGKQKIKLTLSQEAEWEAYFTTEASKVNAIKTQINATDKAIDAMVYELYGLSEEEIGIVESSN